MLRSYWRVVLATGLALTSSAGSVYGAQNHQGSNSKSGASAEPKSAPPIVSPKPPTYEYPYSCQKPKSAEQDSLCIQTRAADAAEDSANWARATVDVGIAGTIAVVLTLAANAYATFLMHREYIASHRPRMRLRWAKLISPPVAGQGINCRLVFANCGDSEAKIISASGDCAIRIRDTMTGLSENKIPNGKIAKPGQQVDFNIVSSFRPTQEQIIQLASEEAELWIGGIIHYDDRNGTRRITHIMRKFDGSTNVFLRPEAGHPYSEQDFEN